MIVTFEVTKRSAVATPRKCKKCENYHISAQKTDILQFSRGVTFAARPQGHDKYSKFRFFI